MSLPNRTTRFETRRKRIIAWIDKHISFPSTHCDRFCFLFSPIPIECVRDQCIRCMCVCVCDVCALERNPNCHWNSRDLWYCVNPQSQGARIFHMNWRYAMRSVTTPDLSPILDDMDREQNNNNNWFDEAQSMRAIYCVYMKFGDSYECVWLCAFSSFHAHTDTRARTHPPRKNNK